MVKLGWTVGLGLLLAACGGSTAPEGDPSLTGEIVQVSGQLLGPREGVLYIHVKEDPGEECGIIFSVDEDTWITDSTRGSLRRADTGILGKGATVQLWFRLVLDSCPGQAHADAVNRIV